MKQFNFTHDFTDDEIEILKKYRDKESNIRLKLRFAALIFIALKTDASVVASGIGISEFTIENWYNQYVSEGIESIASFNYKPKQAYLNFFQINQTVIYVTFENPKNLKQIKEYIKEKFGVDYALESVRILLKKTKP